MLSDPFISEFTNDEIETSLTRELGLPVRCVLPVGTLVESAIPLARAPGGRLRLASREPSPPP